MKALLRLAISTAVLIPEIAGATENTKEDFSLIPQIHGVIRTTYEMLTDDTEGRFQVKNARLNVSGKVAPVISYFIQFDCSAKGKMKFLDAYGLLNVSKQVAVKAGQFREPFGVDNFLGPGTYYFTNTSFIQDYICNYRGTGAQLGYAPESVPFKAEAGVFNCAGIEDHEVWEKSPAFASKVSYRIGNVTLYTGFQSVKPGMARMNLIDGTVSWKAGEWKAEGEYMMINYTNDVAPVCHTYNFYVNRGFDVKAGVFNRASVQARLDGHGNYYNGKLTDSETGAITLTKCKRNRVTVGGTLNYTYKKVSADVRLNYEKYLYGSSVDHTKADGDKVCAELVIKF